MYLSGLVLCSAYLFASCSGLASALYLSSPLHEVVLSLLCPQKGGDKLGYEAEALAIYDTMRYVKPAVGTVCVGSAYGEAALLLAAGEKVPAATCVCNESENCVDISPPPA